jgi:hypothetical protein
MFDAWLTGSDVCILLANTSPSLYCHRVVPAGDSLTERGFSTGGWCAALAHKFYRKVQRGGVCVCVCVFVRICVYMIHGHLVYKMS